MAEELDDNPPPAPPKRKISPKEKSGKKAAKKGVPNSKANGASPETAPSAASTGIAEDAEDGGGEEDEDWEDDEDNGSGEESGDEDEAPGCRRSKSKEERIAAKGKPPGPKGRFRGEQRALLEQLVPKYDAVPKGKRGKNPALQQFWTLAENTFWARFTIPEARSQMGKGYKRAKKKAVLEKTNESIRNWFRWRARTAGTNSPWQTALLFLRRSADSAPKRMATWQLLHSKKAKEIQELYEARKDDERVEIVVRNEIARELFNELSEEERAELEKEVDDQFQEQKRRYDAGVEGLRTPSHDDQLEARERLCGVVWPLLQLIAKYTGLQCLTLLGAEAPTDPTQSFDVSVVNYGETTGIVPHDFRSFNGPAFNGVLGVFAQFVAAVAGMEPNVGENGLPSFNIKLAESVGGKQNVPAKPANTSGNAATAEQRIPVPLPAPAQVLQGGDSLMMDGPDDVESATRVTAKATAGTKGTKGKGKARGKSANSPSRPTNEEASPAPASGSLNTPTATTLAGLSLAELVHYGPNHAVQPFSNSTHPTEDSSANKDASPTYFNINPSLLGDLSGSRIPPAYAPPPSAQALGSELASPCVASVPTPTFGLNAVGTSLNCPFPEATSPSLSSTTTAPSSSNGAATATISPEDVPNVDDAPALVQDQLGYLHKTLVPASVVASWTRLLRDWIEFERMRNFESKRSGLLPTGRPGAISWWIKCARKGCIDPAIVESEDYVGKWGTWWQVINPSWRDCVNDRLVIGGEGEWDKMLHTGTNGWVNVIASIDALCRVADQSTIAYAITDASWALNQVLQAEKGANAPINSSSTRHRKRSSKAASVDETLAPKRTRRAMR